LPAPNTHYPNKNSSTMSFIRSSNFRRRAVQTITLVIFFALMLYVVHPGTAKPPWTVGSWVPKNVDATAGHVTLSTDMPAEPNDPLTADTIVHAYDRNHIEPVHLGQMRVIERGANTVTLAVDPADSPLKPAWETTFGNVTIAELGPGESPAHFAKDLQRKNRPLPADSFLAVDPLVGIGATLGSHAFSTAAFVALIALFVCIILPRWFCGYACPLGTLIDLFDRIIVAPIGKLLGWKKRRLGRSWTRVRYYTLFAVLGSAALGVSLIGYFAPIPLLTRATAILGVPIENTLLDRPYTSLTAVDIVAGLTVLAVVLLVGFITPRFWCRYLCPSGAAFSLFGLLRIRRRHVNEEACRACTKCATACPFDAVSEDYLKTTAACAACKTCETVCPLDGITVGVKKPKPTSPKPATATAVPPDECIENEQDEVDRMALNRRGLLRLGAGSAIFATVGAAGGFSIGRFGAAAADEPAPLRPPGSVGEDRFAAQCVRCGLCIAACASRTLGTLGTERGVNNLWTPVLHLNRAGCDPSCNRCGQVCPTGAIRSLTLDQKNITVIGRAELDEKTCLAFCDDEDVNRCRDCLNVCAGTGRYAIEIRRVDVELDEQGMPIEDSGRDTLVVLQDRCVGCGLCQSRCHLRNVEQRKLLSQSAIEVIERDRGALVEDPQSVETHPSDDYAPPQSDDYLPEGTVDPLPGDPVEALPGDPIEALPGDPVEALPGDPVDFLPGEPVGPLPGDPVEGLPGDPVDFLPGEALPGDPISPTSPPPSGPSTNPFGPSTQ